MSRGTFVRNNLFLPMQLFVARRLRGRKTLATIVGLVPLALSFMFVAVWHRLSVPFLLWGIAMAVVMVLEKLVRDHVLARGWAERRAVRGAWRVIGPIYTMSIIITGIHFVAKEIFVS